jgi:hypothetical protein
MADTLDGHGYLEGEEVGREARKIREKYFNIGFKQGIFETRQEHIQPGFDAGFHTIATQSFCTAFIKELPVELRPRQAATDFTDIAVENLPQELEDLHQHIELLIHDKIKCIEA